jgi:hypothetical protein
MFRRTLAVAVPAVLLVGAAVPASSSAGTITPTAACYAHVPVGPYQDVTVNVAGGPPAARFQVRGVGGKAGSAIGDLDPAGNATATLSNGFSTGGIDPSKGRTIALEAADQSGTGAVFATGSIQVTNVALKIDLKTRSPFSPAVWTMSGLTPVYGAGPLYASYVNGKSGSKVIKRVKLGTPNACGYLRVKRVAPPKRAYRTWTIYVHVGKSLDKKKSLVAGIKTYKRFF